MPTHSFTLVLYSNWLGDDTCKELKHDANFWYKVCCEAGRPSTGILSDIKKNSKRKYKYHVIELKRKQNKLNRERLAKSFAEKRKDGFGSAVKNLKCGSTSRASVANGCTDSSDIANIFATNLSNLLTPTLPSTAMQCLPQFNQSSQLMKLVGYLYLKMRRVLLLRTKKNR